MPNVGDLIASVSYKNGYIRFSTPETFRDGNAVIAAKNSSGTILWSWHIWCAEEGWQEQIYYNDAGTMMDRNLGATSAAPGDVGALGLMYQWGRKDPFLGSSSISSNILAVSTGTWSTASKGSVSLTEANPMTFFTTTHLPEGCWESDKTVYDPCPAGWRVPDGGESGVWAKALGTSSQFTDTSLYDNTNKGTNFSGKIGASSVIWYPASGYRFMSSGSLEGVPFQGFSWSCTPDRTQKYHAYCLHFYKDSYINPLYHEYRANGYSVRCQKE